MSDRIWCGCAVRDLLMMVEFWELGMAWRQWKFWVGVHRAKEILRRFGMERIRCNSSVDIQFVVFNLYNGDIAAVGPGRQHQMRRRQ